MPPPNPLAPYLERQGFLVIDGGLATELEARGYDLRDPLWSARVLLESPAAIRQVHLDYLRAGADCLITAGYQATPQGLRARGLSETQINACLRLTVQLAEEARAQFLAESPATGRLRPLIAAGIGPYGAYLANGAEYTGAYDLSVAELMDFHRQRWEVLADSSADILACETIPSLAEAQALAQLLAQTPDRVAWFSFSCRNETQISDGTRLADGLAWLEAFPQVVAVGVNCTPPRLIPGLIAAARQATTRSILVYPNSGEIYAAVEQTWRGERDSAEFGQAAQTWYAAGATLIGGCCRTGPAHIAGVRAALTKLSTARMRA